MYNVNYGRNRELMEACEPLKEYAWFIDQIRKNQNIGFEIVEAVGHAIETMPEGFTLKGFLENHRGVTIMRSMIQDGYDEWPPT